MKQEQDDPREPDGRWSRIPFLAALSAADREPRRTRARERRISRAEEVWQLGAVADEFVFVLRGRVKLVTSNADGHDAIVDLRGPGQLLCSGAACVRGPYCCTAVAHASAPDPVEACPDPRPGSCSAVPAAT